MLVWVYLEGGGRSIALTTRHPHSKGEFLSACQGAGCSDSFLSESL